MIIGITGKSGSGKTTYACQIAEGTDFWVINIDKIAHNIMNLTDNQWLLKDIFGAEAIKDGVVDRKYIGDLLFTNRHKYEAMCDVIWYQMKCEIDRILSMHENVILDWILLPHTHYWKMCDKKILVVADEEDRKRRVMVRDNISAEYLSKRDAAGISYNNIAFDQIIYTTKEEYRNAQTI